MGDNLAELLYAEWRRSQDVTVTPSWGNLDTEVRESWERVANLAGRLMSLRFVASIDHELALANHNAEPRDETLMVVRARWSR